MAFVDIDDFYPLKFAPIYQERLWGGTQISEVLGRKLPNFNMPIGESWELCDRPGVESVVINGPLAGHTLHELLLQYRGSLVGSSGAEFERFPLLVKLIDAGKRLSLQVHPDERYCRELNDGSEPKTEMWYLLSAKPGAKILAGLTPRSTKQRLMELLDSPEAENMLQIHPSVPGDAYFITAGTLHAIGAGNLLLEIQQNSDTTMRISDWGRVDSSGNPRQLHRKTGIPAINFTNRTSPRIAGDVGSAGYNRKFDVVRMCPYFRVTELRLVKVWHEDTGAGNSFHLLSAVNHPIQLVSNKQIVDLLPGETALIPAAIGSYDLVPVISKESKVIKTTL